MLQEVCEYIHNYFIKEAVQDSFEISGGAVSLPFVKEGQRFLIIGSDLNDGIYTYHASGIKNDDDDEAAGLQDETWAGTICALAVPPPVIALSGEIKVWVDQYSDAINSPYQSESVIGVYSYEKAQYGGNRNGNSSPATWRDVFGAKLNRWRKVAF
jgi:hypothetical protein